MAESVNYCLSNENFVANGAVLTFGKTGVCAIGIDCVVNNFGVTERINYGLSNENFVTNGAVLTFGKTGVCAIGSDSSINDLGVAESVNYCLSNENFVANGAVLTFGKTGVCAIGIDCVVNNFGVTESVNYCLRNDNCITNGAVLTLGKTVFLALGSNSSVNFFGVTESVNYRLRNDNCITNGAVFTLGKTGFLALGSNSSINDLGVAESGYKGFATYSTSLSSGTSCFSVGGMLVLATTGKDCDAINSNLSVRENKSERINCFGEGDCYSLIGNYCVGTCGGEGFSARSCVSGSIAYNNDLGHSGAGNNQLRTLVETGGFCIITNITGGATLVVGNSNTVHYPDLLGGGKFGAVCLIIKAEGCFCFGSAGG